MLALINAARSFKPELGNQFKTYAWSAVDHDIADAVLGKRTDALNQPSISLDAPVYDSVDDKYRAFHDVIAADWEDMPRLTQPMLKELKAALSDTEFTVLCERLAGVSQAAIGQKLGLTPQRISQIQEEAARKGERAIERARYPRDCRRDAMADARYAFNARSPLKIADGSPRQLAGESINEWRQRRKNYWGWDHYPDSCPNCCELSRYTDRPELWAGQMPGQSSWARQQNRRFVVEWANYDINPASGLRCNPQRQLSPVRRPIGAPWYIDDEAIKPAAIEKQSSDQADKTLSIDGELVVDKERKRFEGFDKKDPKLDGAMQASMTCAERLRRVLEFLRD